MKLFEVKYCSRVKLRKLITAEAIQKYIDAHLLMETQWHGDGCGDYRELDRETW